MLGQSFSEKSIRQNIVPRRRWKPFPSYAERGAWTALPREVRMRLIRSARRNVFQAWPELPATLYLEFARNGNRSRFEAKWFERRSRLVELALAECMEGKGAFLDPLANAIWSVCEESTWSLPAHLSLKGLPDIGEPNVDLFAAETGALLAWIHYLFGNALDEVAPVIAPRISGEIDKRVLTPCLERTDFWWMGLCGNRVNNWNPWINSNWLACNLLVEPDGDRRIRATAKMLQCLARFVDPYPNDGGCDEGPGYWCRAGASLFDALDLLYRAIRGRLNLFEHEKVREIGRFIVRAHIANRWFLNFADAPAVMQPPAGLVYRFGRRIGDRGMQNFARSFFDPLTLGAAKQMSSIFRMLSDFFDADALKPNAKPPLLRDVFLPNIQVMTARSKQGSTRGFFLAAKGGHNAESHNHNDVGHFVVYHNGSPVLADIGVETYTRKTFGPHRYEIWTMQSAFHNLPVINGIQQMNGRQFQARSVSWRASAGKAVFSLDIAHAWPARTGVKSWQRTLSLDRGVGVVLCDKFECSRAPKSLEWMFITPCRPKATRAGVSLLARKLPQRLQTGAALLGYDRALFKTALEPLPIKDSKLALIWGDCLFRIRLTARAPGLCGQALFTLSSRDRN